MNLPYIKAISLQQGFQYVAGKTYTHKNSFYMTNVTQATTASDWYNLLSENKIITLTKI